MMYRFDPLHLDEDPRSSRQRTLPVHRRWLAQVRKLKEISKAQQLCSPSTSLRCFYRLSIARSFKVSAVMLSELSQQGCAEAMSLRLALAQFAQSLSYCYFNHENNTFSLSCRSG